MKSGAIVAVLVAAIAFATSAPCAAQKPARSFSQLGELLKPGDTVWITDAQGREVTGTIESLGPDAISLDADEAAPIAAADVKAISKRRDVATGIGAWSGLAAGTAYAIGILVRYPEDTAEEPGIAAAIVLGYGGIGALVGAGIGWGIDAARDSKKEVYRAPGTGGGSTARLAIAPVVTPRAKGVAVSFAF
jgi:hypothetical protein